MVAGWLLLTAVLAAARLPVFELWGDVRFTLGVERVTARTGWSSWEIWAHRPMLNRVLMAGADHLTGGAHREQQLYLLGALCCGLVIAWLHRQLRRGLGGVESAGLCAGLLAALVWAPSPTVLQPEWWAALTAVAGVALGLVARRGPSAERLVALGVGLLLAATVLMKLTTIGTAATAWAVVALWCWPHFRARVLRVTVASAAMLVLLGAAGLLVEQERVWLAEMPALNPDPGSLQLCAPWRPPSAECGLQAMLRNVAIASPLVLLLPATTLALVVLTRGRLRLLAVAVPVVGVAGALATTLVQAQWFVYHAAAVPLLAAAWAGWALTRWFRHHGTWLWPLAVPFALTGLASLALLALPTAWRTSREPFLGDLAPAQLPDALAVLVVAGSVAAVGGAVGAAGSGLPRRPAQPLGLVVGASLSLAVTVAAPVLPGVAYAYEHGPAGKTAAGEQERRRQQAALGEGVRAAIGPDTPVVYVAFGERSYWVDNPTHCRYAAATFLQRSVYVPTAHLRSFADNLACLSDPRARFLVREDRWLHLHRVDPAVRQGLEDNFDCSRPTYERSGVTICPRRP